MKRKYWIEWGNFSNTYRLFWTCPETENLVPETAEQISRKRAFQFCRNERRRRRWNQSSAGYADIAIYPAEFSKMDPAPVLPWYPGGAAYTEITSGPYTLQVMDGFIVDCITQ